MKKPTIKRFALLLIFSVILGLTSCGGQSGGQSAEFDPDWDYDTIVEQAKGQTVNFYGWGRRRRRRYRQWPSQ